MRIGEIAKRTTLNICLLGMCFAIIGVYACGFVRYRRAKKKYTQKSQTVREGEDR